MPKAESSGRSEDSSIPAQSMLLHADPGLAEVPGFRKEQLDALARSVELRRQQLEADIRDYIAAKQDELRRHGHEVCVPAPSLLAMRD